MTEVRNQESEEQKHNRQIGRPPNRETAKSSPDLPMTQLAEGAVQRLVHGVEELLEPLSFHRLAERVAYRDVSASAATASLLEKFPLHVNDVFHSPKAYPVERAA